MFADFLSKKLKKGSSVVGIVLGILLFLIRINISVFPFVMIDAGFILTFVLILLSSFIPLTTVVFWIWGLVSAINGVQDGWAIAYYVIFCVLWIPFYLLVVLEFVAKIIGKSR